MNPKTTGLLALVALLLGAFVYFYEIEGETARESARESEKRLFAGLDAASIESLELTTTDGVAARFARPEGAWRVIAPVEDSGDAAALDAIASALAQLVRAGTVQSSPGDLDQFGLGAQARIVRFEAEGAPHSLRIGRSTPVGGNVYVAVDDSDEVAFVEGFRLNAFRHDLTELRDRRIAALDAAALATLAIAWPDAGATTRVELERDASDVWRIRAPIEARADQQTVRELISNLEYLQATQFVDERTPEIEAALSETALELSWTERAASEGGAQAGAEPARSLRIAGLEGGARIVERGGRLYRLAPERLEDFVRRRDAYRDRQLVELAPGALAKIELAFADGASVAWTRGESGWSAADRAIDADAVSGLADQLATLRSEQIVADGMGERELASVGLAPPAVKIVLSTADAAGEPIGLELGRLDPERGLFARRTGQTEVHALAASLAETLPLDRAQLEARYERKPEASSAPDASAAPEASEAPEASATPAPSDALDQ